MQHPRHNADHSPVISTTPPTRLLTVPPRPSRLVFRETYAGMAVGPTVDGSTMDLDAIRRLRLQLECISRATAHSSRGSNGEGGLCGAMQGDEEAPDVAEDEYDDHSVVVRHSGQRQLPALHLRCRWRKASSRSKLMVLYLKLRQKVLNRAWKFVGKFRQAKGLLLHRNLA